MFRINTAALEWYQTLDINRRITLKEISDWIVGYTWTDLGLLFSIPERITILYEKLVAEGFILK